MCAAGRVPHPRMILSTLEMRDSMTPILEDTWGGTHSNPSAGNMDRHHWRHCVR